MRLAQLRPLTGISLICSASMSPPTSADVRFTLSATAFTSTASATPPTASWASIVRAWPTVSSTSLYSAVRNPAFEMVTRYAPIGTAGTW
jgi:hypothetical protein